MSLKTTSERLERGAKLFWDHTEPEPPTTLQEYKTVSEFAKHLQAVELEHRVFLHQICVYFGSHDQIRCELCPVQWWLLRARFLAAESLLLAIDSTPFDGIPSVLEPSGSDEQLIVWLLTNYWEFHAEIDWMKDLQLWFYQTQQ